MTSDSDSAATVDPTRPFLLGDWRVDPAACTLARGDELVRLEVRAMRLVVGLAARAGAVMSIEELLTCGWPDVVVGQDSVYQAVAALRRQLGDDARQPAYIATAPRLGYRLVAAVLPCEAEVAAPAPRAAVDAEVPAASAVAAPPVPPAAARWPRVRRFLQRVPPEPLKRRLQLGLLGACAVAALAVAVIVAFPPPTASARAAAAPRTVAVMPFLDLTTAMDEEPFADGMTEQLIDSVGRLPGVRVASRTATFAYKDKPVGSADLGRALGVDYVLEGSVRKSGATLRVTTRLVHASDGWVVWSQSVDRPFADILKVQDEIAAEVGKALARSLPPR